MLKGKRLTFVMEDCKNMITEVIPQEKYEEFLDKVKEVYVGLRQEEYAFDIDENYYNWLTAIVSVFSVLKNYYQVPGDQAIQVIHKMTYQTTEKIFNKLSLIQMTYYLICDRGFLKQLILNSLAAFDKSQVENTLDGSDKRGVAEGSDVEQNVKEYLNYHQASELMELFQRLDTIIDDFIMDNFRKKKKIITLDELHGD